MTKQINIRRDLINPIIGVLLFAITCLLNVGCDQSTKKESQKTAFTKQAKEDTTITSLERKISNTDEKIALHDPKYFKVYVKLENGEWIKVDDVKNFSNDYSETVNLLFDSEKKIIALLEIPYSESGDYTNVNTHFFDEDGRTIAHRISSFFSGDNCSLNGGNVTEQTLDLYNNNFINVKHEYQLTDQDDKKVDSMKCIFNYRFPENEKVFKNIRSVPVIKELNLIKKFHQ